MSDIKKILIVEDGLISEQMAKFALKSLGDVDIDSIDTGEEALALMHKTAYDIIFMDLGLPDMDGIQVTKQVRQSEQQQNLKATPIIALTGQTGASAASAAGISG